MIDPFLTYNGVRSHIDDLRDDACMSRLAALATCCKPSTWSRMRDRLVKSPASA